MKQFFKENRVQFVILGIAFIVLIVLSISVKKDKNEFENTLGSMLRVVVEQSYADGQIDALAGDVRVKQVNDSAWVFIKSPWSDSSITIKDTIIHKP
ncbi:MAG: hypothetical protein WC333_00250 [Dehalococcoidia bacterium]|jgi:hypothetical protein